MEQTIIPVLVLICVSLIFIFIHSQKEATDSWNRMYKIAKDSIDSHANTSKAYANLYKVAKICTHIIWMEQTYPGYMQREDVKETIQKLYNSWGKNPNYFAEEKTQETPVKEETNNG